MKKVSIIIPCRNEEDNLSLLVSEIIKNIPRKFQLEVIFVDDGSIDETPKVIKKLCSRNKFIKGVILSKGFGQQAALMAGLNLSSGEAVITMDADFQHPPEMLPKIIELWESGHDLVLLQDKDNLKSKRRGSIGTTLGYLVWHWVTNGFLVPGVSEFRLMDKRVVNYILDLKERELFLRGLVNLGAKNPVVLPYNVRRRLHGKSEYRFSSSLDIFMNGLISFSTKPLRITAFLGLLIFILSIIFLVGDVIFSLLLGRQIVSGYITIVFLMTLLNGFIIFYLGILGEYIAVIFKEVKERPMYFIEKKINF